MEISRDHVWGAIILMRDHARWGGNRFEIDLGGINFTIQRRGRAARKKLKFSDTYLARGKHEWLIIVRGFDFQMLTPKAPEASLAPYRHRFNECEIEFKGDYDMFEHDFIMMKMFGEWR